MSDMSRSWSRSVGTNLPDDVEREGANHGCAIPGGDYHDVGATRSYERARALFDQALRR